MSGRRQSRKLRGYKRVFRPRHYVVIDDEHHGPLGIRPSTTRDDQRVLALFRLTLADNNVTRR